MKLTAVSNNAHFKAIRNNGRLQAEKIPISRECGSRCRPLPARLCLRTRGGDPLPIPPPPIPNASPRGELGPCYAQDEFWLTAEHIFSSNDSYLLLSTRHLSRVATRRLSLVLRCPELGCLGSLAWFCFHFLFKWYSILSRRNEGINVLCQNVDIRLCVCTMLLKQGDHPLVWA